jgi:hypothetical protein
MKYGGCRPAVSCNKSAPAADSKLKGIPMTTVGVPREIKQDEYRVAMLPVGVLELTRRGHRVVIQSGAGSGIPDEAYTKNGADVVDDAASVFEQADLIVKVKEPQSVEWPLLRPGQIVFTYFHFAASQELMRGVIGRRQKGTFYFFIFLACLSVEARIRGQVLTLFLPASEYHRTVYRERGCDAEPLVRLLFPPR